ncbi:hypothetical protein [Acidaminococcus intestini]|jgi:hypothetical protein|uniref:hypothetical protein n=1 Tax=Acidaminococcus intestini TaxID=187327 RepID=UPI0026651344|nr:hypothetical protein [Acidaminococcus intestini]
MAALFDALTRLAGYGLALTALAFLAGLTSLANLAECAVPTIIDILDVVIQFSERFLKLRYVDSFNKNLIFT